MEEQELERLDYRLIGASSEDPEHPLFSLLTPASPQHNSGWHSVRFCAFPQEILLNFPSPVRLREISLVFHESFIPTKVEFYHFFPTNYNDFFTDPGQLTYTKIGYTIPNNNLKSNYSARELKKIFLNENCYYLKIVLYKNYQNQFNLFNQIALVKINCFGFQFKRSNIDILFPIRDKNVNYFPNNLDQYIPEPEMDEKDMDPSILKKKNEIQQVLDDSIKEENYDLAKSLNEVIQRLKFYAIKIKQFSDIKMKSIQIADFDTAKRMKLEIDKIRAYIESLKEGELISSAMNSNLNFKREQNFNEIGEDLQQQEMQMNMDENNNMNNMDENYGDMNNENMNNIPNDQAMSKSDEIRMAVQAKKDLIRQSKEQASKNLKEENRKLNLNVEGRVRNNQEDYEKFSVENTHHNEEEEDAVHQQIKVKK